MTGMLMTNRMPLKIIKVLRPSQSANDYIRIELTDRNNDIAIIVFQAGALAIYHRPEAVKAQLVNIMPSDLPL
jgi:hypothetical protein